MNWTRGLLRVWAVIAVCWIGVVGNLRFGQLAFSSSGFFDPDKFLKNDPYAYSIWPDWHSFVGFSEEVLLPPMGLLLLGFLTVWALRGFRP